MPTNDITINSPDLARHIIGGDAPKPDDGPVNPGPQLSPDFVQAQEATAGTLEYRAGILQAEGKAREAARLLASASMIRGTLAEAKATAGYQAPRVVETQTPEEKAYGIGPEVHATANDLPAPTEHASADDLISLAGALAKSRADINLQRAVLRQVANGPGKLDGLNASLQRAGFDHPAKAIDAVTAMLARNGSKINPSKLSAYSWTLLAAHAKHVGRIQR